VSLPLTKWGMRWQNERYVRSAQNQDDIEDLKTIVNNLEKRITELEKK
jgi:ubiquinone biosynthesis protein UbiJ